MDKTLINVIDLFESKQYLKVCAPMVRYSKLPFRTLVREYDCDMCFTPMIMADSFCQSVKARNNEFTTNLLDAPLITQFAANTVQDFVGASYMISPFCNGVDLNCGCPQRWAKQMGLGCVMLEKPELISQMVKDCRNNIPKPFTVSVKIRILKDLKKCVEVCRQLEKAGVSFLSVHARTPTQLTGDINTEALKLIVENVHCPVIANGGVKSLNESDQLHNLTKCKGIMAANGILTNPELFSGGKETSIGCIQKWLDICYNSTIPLENYEFYLHKTPIISDKPLNLTFQCFHHHLVFMLEKVLSKQKRRIFNNLQKFQDVLDFIENEFGLIPRLYEYDMFKKTNIFPVNYDSLKFNADFCDKQISKQNDYESIRANGKYFNEKITCHDSDDDDLNDIFKECG